MAAVTKIRTKTKRQLVEFAKRFLIWSVLLSSSLWAVGLVHNELKFSLSKNLGLLSATICLVTFVVSLKFGAYQKPYWSLPTDIIQDMYHALMRFIGKIVKPSIPKETKLQRAHRRLGSIYIEALLFAVVLLFYQFAIKPHDPTINSLSLDVVRGVTLAIMVSILVDQWSQFKSFQRNLPNIIPSDEAPEALPRNLSSTRPHDRISPRYDETLNEVEAKNKASINQKQLATSDTGEEMLLPRIQVPKLLFDECKVYQKPDGSGSIKYFFRESYLETVLIGDLHGNFVEVHPSQLDKQILKMGLGKIPKFREKY